MKKILYTKFSRERREEFRIVTKITEENGKRQVWKQPLYDMGKEHVLKMQENYPDLKDNYICSGIEICPCKWDEDKEALCFPFIYGESMDKKLSRFGNEKNFSGIKQEYEKLWKVISSVKEQKKFCVTEEFSHIFGDPSLPENLMASGISNIDMIPGNIVTNGSEIWITDYEWVFRFPIPFTFVYARSIFLQETVCMLSDEEQRELYSIAGILPDQIPVYYQMEERFQKYVSGTGENTLAYFYKKLHRRSYPFNLWKKEKTLYPVKLEETAPVYRELYYCDYSDLDVQCSVDISKAEPDASLVLSIMEEGGIIKIRSLMGEKQGVWKNIPFSHHADLNVIDDYYFTEKPQVIFQNAGYRKIKIDYMIYYKGCGITSQFIGFIRENKDLKETVQCIGNEKKILEEELESMRQRKVVRMADAVHEIIKKG